MADGIHSCIIRKNGWSVCIKYDQISLFAHFDASDAVGSSDGCCSVECHGCDSFRHTEMHIDASQCKSQWYGTGTTASRIEVGKQGDLVVLDADTPAILPYYTGMNAVRNTIKRGKIIY